MMEHFCPTPAAVCCDPVEPEEIIIAFCRDALILPASGSLPRGGEWNAPAERLLIGKIGTARCSFLETEEIPESFQLVELRSALQTLPHAARIAVCRGRELAHWRRNRQFCGKCGSKLVDLEAECARKCTECGALFYPAISPAVIVAVTAPDGKLLLAHNRKFREGLFSLIAGFVEAGETMEEAVRREVAEEVGITVCNIRYFGSQCWPYPNSLMAGFTAEYVSGEVSPDGDEITEAGFYTPDTMPEPPGPGSIARTMIDQWKQNYRKNFNE